MSAQEMFSQNFGNTEIALLFLLIAFAMGLSKFLKLDLEKDFFLASVRTTFQLIAVGYILRWVFKSDSLAVNFLILFVMTLVAAQAVTSRLKQKNMKFYVASCLAIFASVWPLGFAAIEIFFKASGFTNSLFFIPFMGVLMGNALSAISLTFVGLERVRGESLLEIETFKALGANSVEACARLYRDLLRSALTPILNGMTIVGIVSLPGVMAGQLIGGVDPLIAARFQILVMFLILLTALAGALWALLANHTYFMPQWLTHKTEALDFDLQAGSRMILSGPSGMGKSRLLKSMTGLDEAQIALNQQRKSAQAFKNSSDKVMYLPQRAFFVPGTVRENLQLPATFKNNSGFAYDENQVIANLAKLGLSANIMDKKATTLSGGEAQLIHLARALQLKPDVLFLDEPTSSLDAHKTELFEQFLNQWCQNGNQRLVMITHSQEQMKRFASQVLYLKEEGLTHV